MSIFLKFLKRRGLFLISSFLVLGILISLFLILNPKNQNYNKTFKKKTAFPKYLFLQSNTLLPLSPLFFQKEKTMIKIVTAYWPHPSETDETPCISASGMDICQIKKRICASNEFPFGTKLLIDGKVWEVQDRMNPKFSDRIDLFFKNKKEVEDWGKRKIKVIKLN
jgi:3D (Asp-Asp-Asp) domain-containing protein